MKLVLPGRRGESESPGQVGVPSLSGYIPQNDYFSGIFTENATIRVEFCWHLT